MEDEVARARRETLELIETDGIRAAAEAAIAVASDPKATPQARATASGILMRAARLGGFGKTTEDARTKDISEMTSEEVAATLAETRRALRQSGPEDDGLSVFD